jgi:hypothetical protein
MPIRAFLDGHSFDGETVRLMGIAFEMALGSLRATPDHADPVREAVARKIIELAKAGERDPERLCEGALCHVGIIMHCAPAVQHVLQYASADVEAHASHQHFAKRSGPASKPHADKRSLTGQVRK